MQIITSYLHRYTMYQLVVRYLIGLQVIALGLAWAGVLELNPVHILTDSLTAVGAGWVINSVLAQIFRTQTNKESWLITSLILGLVIGPAVFANIWLPIVVACSAALTSKFVLRWKSHHIFNPAAFGLLVMSMTLGTGSSWWVGSWPLIVITVLGGLVILHKIRRLTLSLWFIGSYLLIFVLLNGLKLDWSTNFSLLRTLTLESPLIFFATIMLVEPATSPTSRNLWPGYAVLTAAIALLLQRYLPTVPYSLELALLGGNILTRVVERRNTFPLTLIRREKLTSNIESFFFEIAPRIHFQPGQFLEWTVPHAAPDSRGIRRWFTIASAPTEPVIQLTTRFSKKSSSFKASLRSLKIGDRIVAHGLEGDFTLPADKTKGLVFIAGGIGITPFRSMIKFLLDSGEARDITLIYATKRVEDLVFMNIFEQAKEAFGIKIVPVVAEPDTTWHGRAGRVDQALFTEEAPDIKTSEVYISGPEPMVESISGLIRDLGVPNHSIHQDFFPGYPANDAIKQKVEN